MLKGQIRPVSIYPVQIRFMLSPSVFPSLLPYSLSLAVAVLTMLPSSALAQSTNPEALPAEQTEDLRPLAQDSSLLSVRGAQRLMTEASDAVAAQNYELAVRKLQEARQVFNQLSNFYQELSSSFNGIDNRIADGQRDLAFETAQMRDEATYQLALVHRAQNQPELAVPLLIQIVKSQQPTRDLGQRAYRQLFELGFVDSPYPRNQDTGSTTPSPNSQGLN
jgi:hypothetical protein